MPRTEQPLQRAEVVEAALAVLDRDGPQALSMRRLATELGVGTMTVYGAFRDKAELLDAVVDAAWGDEPPAPGSGPWRAQLTRLAIDAHRRLTRHPGLVRLRREGPLVRPRQLAVTEVAVTILITAGFPREEAMRTFRTLFAYLFGYAMVSADADAAAARDVLVHLPSDRFPLLSDPDAAADMAATMGGETQFLHGLELLLDGIEARLARLEG